MRNRALWTMVAAVALAACTTATDDADWMDPAGGGASSGGDTCQEPRDYPEECADVSRFECGFEVTCQGDNVKVGWHEHLRCESRDDGWGGEIIANYSCTHRCPNGCDESYTDWPSSGFELVRDICLD